MVRFSLSTINSAKQKWGWSVFYARGIAKAAPDDCFNVHIGKAIALHRALGLEVPDEYLNAPQPTEVRVGDAVRLSSMIFACLTAIDVSAALPPPVGSPSATTVAYSIVL